MLDQLYDKYLNTSVITTDSRNVPEGSMFFALKGGNFDGNRYAAAALEKGAAYAVIDNPEFASSERCIIVPDALAALQQLAAYHRSRLTIPVIGITGTNGKTTTKELTSAVLSKKFRTRFTRGNLNNHIGVPLTLLSIRPDDEIAVVEMGANHPGEIKFLVDIARPDYGLITNVGRAHLEGFGSFEGVKKTKGELYDFLRSSGGRAFLDASNEHLTAMAAERGIEAIRYGLEGCEGCLVSGAVESLSPYLSARINGRIVTTALVGSYNLSNILAAACVGSFFGVADDDIAAAISGYRPTNSRSEWRRAGTSNLIIDAYNANPTSMAAAIENLHDIEAEHKCAILADMGELGADSEAEHQKIADLLRDRGIDDAYLIGKNFMLTTDNMVHFDSTEQFLDYMGRDDNARSRFSGKTILIKGSNSMKMSDAAAFLIQKLS